MTGMRACMAQARNICAVGTHGRVGNSEQVRSFLRARDGPPRIKHVSA
jgi:hypothetical protein